MTKAERIKSAIQGTRERRANLRPAVFELKLQNLSRKKEELLSRAFLEAKWLYNWLVSDLGRLNLPANKVDAVEVKVGDGFEERRLVLLGSQIKQEIADRLKDNLWALKKLKERGYRVGPLKPKRFVHSIPLKQYGVTYSLDFARNRVRIQKLGEFRVLGLHQIPSDAEIANAMLVRKPSGYYLHVTCYLPQEHFSRKPVGEAVGIDFGVSYKLPEGQEGEVEHPAPVGERGTLKLYLSPFCGVRGARPREGMVLQVVLGDGQEILWDGSRLYWKAEGKRLPLYPPSEGPLFFLGVWEGDGSFRLLFSPATSEFPGGVILALRVGEGWLEAERWRKGAEPFPTERIDGRFLPLGFGTSPEEVVSFFEKVWGTP